MPKEIRKYKCSSCKAPMLSGDRAYVEEIPYALIKKDGSLERDVTHRLYCEKCGKG